MSAVLTTAMRRSGRELPLTGALTGMNPEPEGAQAASAGTAHAANLHLMTDRGVTIDRMRDANRYAVFMLPPDLGTVKIMSRSARPVSVAGPCRDDHRPRGVLVRHIKLFEGTMARHIVMHLAQKAPEGWHDDFYALRPEPCRWTDGQALLHLGPRHPGMLGVLCMEVLACGPYGPSPAADQSRPTA